MTLEGRGVESAVGTVVGAGGAMDEDYLIRRLHLRWYG